MKYSIHPPYYTKATIHCACGNSMIVGAIKEKIDIEICSACHPFFTGKEKLVDTAGRIEKFKGKVARAKLARPTGGSKKNEPKARRTKKKA